MSHLTRGTHHLAAALLALLAAQLCAGQQQHRATATSPATASSELIKWSFGGWAPLEGRVTPARQAAADSAPLIAAASSSRSAAIQVQQLQSSPGGRVAYSPLAPPPIYRQHLLPPPSAAQRPAPHAHLQAHQRPPQHLFRPPQQFGPPRGDGGRHLRRRPMRRPPPYMAQHSAPQHQPRPQQQQQQLQHTKASNASVSNIQDVKQLQQRQQQQLAPKPQPNHSSAASEYLTIPVAVETDGDKLLTRDEIREIEKHVLDVLPSLHASSDASKAAVKLADAQMAVAQLKQSGAMLMASRAPSTPSHASLHLQQSTTASQRPQQQQQYRSSGSTVATMDEAHANNERHYSEHRVTMQQLANDASFRASSSPTTLSSGRAIDEQYFVAGAPSELDGEQLHELAFMKADLLNNIRYEPTRAAAAAGYSAAQQTASTPPNALLGGRKVSDVMRPLVRTTPVPLTTPMHVPAVEPEKLDAIQLIAGHSGNDRRPVVVEASSLVRHTPADGFDYSSLNANNAGANNATPPVEYVTVGGEQHSTREEPSPSPPPQQPQQPVTHFRPAQTSHTSPHADFGGDDSGATTQAMLPQQHQQPQTYSTPAMTFEYSAAPHTPRYPPPPPPPPTTTAAQHNGATSAAAGDQRPELAWSALLAHEHEQHAHNHNKDGGQLLALELPATAGYNFFSPDSTPPLNNDAHYELINSNNNNNSGNNGNDNNTPADDTPPSPSKWRTKAGGSQPNPDAQYDGQIDKTGAGAESAAEPQADANYAVYRQPQPQPQPQPQQQQQQQPTTPMSFYSNDDAEFANNALVARFQQSAHVAGAQMHHQTTPSAHHFESTAEAQPTTGGGYVPVDRDRQQAHLAAHQAQHQAHVARLMQASADAAFQQTTMHPSQQQQQQQQQPSMTTNAQQMSPTSNNNEQQHSSSSSPQQAIDEQQLQQQQQQPQTQPQPQQHQLISDQQSLIEDASRAAEHLENQPLGGALQPPQHLDNGIGNANDDATDADNDGEGSGKPRAVYSVYQAYYAPKDHMPPPGYVRLSLKEFHDMFRDSEIKYIDNNNNNNNGTAMQDRQSQLLQGFGDSSADNSAAPQQQQQPPPSIEYRVDGGGSPSSRGVSQAGNAAAQDLSDAPSIVVESRLMSDVRGAKTPIARSELVAQTVDGGGNADDDVAIVGSLPGLIGAKLRRNLRQLSRKKVIAISEDAKHLLKSLRQRTSSSSSSSSAAAAAATAKDSQSKASSKKSSTSTAPQTNTTSTSTSASTSKRKQQPSTN